MMFAAGLNDLRKEQRGRWSDRDLRVADEPRLPMRDHGIGKEFQVGIVGERDALCLCRVVGIHGVYLGCRLRGDVRLRARTKRDVERKPITLQQVPPPTARMLMSPAVLTTLIAAFVLAPAIALAHSGHAETTD
jgi:hypothetical protein